MTIVCLLVAIIGFISGHAQRQISGKIISSDDSTGIPGATILVKGTATGVITDVNGRYTLTIPRDDQVIIVSYVGMTTREVTLGEGAVFNIILAPDIRELEGVVVTALGIPREKKSLGYATQEVNGDQISLVKTGNFINSLSGRVAGVQVNTTSNFGGSTNVLLRGTKSLTGDNQALFVIDGVPVNNDNTNTTDQQQAGQGFDYGNAASDINPEDIETVNVLKGSAATALYGSRAANGVIMITTKKGTSGRGVGKKGLGITINSGVTVGFIDRTTFPGFQQEYGAGYGHYYEGPGNNWLIRYINPDGTITINPTGPASRETLWVTTSEDASYGARFDPSLLVYQWDAVDPQSPNFLKATPWVAAKNGPITFFEKPVTFSNSLSVENGSGLGSYRLSYANFKQDGMMPNSELNKNTISLNATWNVNNKLTVSGYGSYSVLKALGRNSTGYQDNIVTGFRQWIQTNVDMHQQRELYEITGRNVTWNYADPTWPYPLYWDNYYWTRYKNYESDRRNRFIGNVSVNYKVTPWLDLFGRISVDTYYELQEERRAVGSVATSFGIGAMGGDGSAWRSQQSSGYLRRDIEFSEYNYDLMANFTKDLSKSFNLKGILGMNIRRTNFSRVLASTNGGLAVPDLYSLQNSAGPLPFPKELASKVAVGGIYASASLGYRDFLYLDATLRRDQSSTLPEDHNAYYYPSVAGSFIFSKLLDKAKWLSFGKLRVNYAVVGNSASFDQLVDNYLVVSPFVYPVTNTDRTKKNPELMPENTQSLEGGLEMYFFGKRLGFDLALYRTTTINQIIPLPVSYATGYTAKVINAGEIMNKGVEISLTGIPVRNRNFTWSVTLNWAMNRNKVVSLHEGADQLVLGYFQGGISITAQVGQPYGTILGTDYTYLNGERLVDPETGFYKTTSTSNNVIGIMNPDWHTGLQNTLTYRNWSLQFLVDVQKGGDMFSLDMYYGLATGVYEETARLNDLGNPVRDPIVWIDPGDPTKGYAATSGGFINEGVNPDGLPNKTRVDAYNSGSLGTFPNRAFVYDATYVKLRNVALSYTLSSRVLKKCFVTGVTFTAVASNLWIICKSIPYVNPESGLGSGNLQGYTTGSLPSTRDFSFNVKISF